MIVSLRAPARAAATACLALALPLSAWAQTQAPPAPDDRAFVRAEPDFALAVLPTTLRMPAGAFVFRMTHRFSRPIAGTCPDEGPRPDGCGGVGAFLENFFGFDSSSKVGLEFRYGLRPGTQLTLHRSNDRAIQMGVHSQLVRQGGNRPITVDLIGAIEGQDNFRDDHTFTAGTVISRQVTDRGALYLQPLLLFNANPRAGRTGGDAHTVMVGVGGRLRLGSTRTYLVAEAAPRLSGYAPNVDHVAFGIERRSGGHVFQLNVSNALGSTLRQIAHGGPGRGDWFIGFNLSRRFY